MRINLAGLQDTLAVGDNTPAFGGLAAPACPNGTGRMGLLYGCTKIAYLVTHRGRRNGSDDVALGHAGVYSSKRGDGEGSEIWRVHP